MPVDDQTIKQQPRAYKIIVDPYYKRFSIERYCYGSFDKIIYDSSFLDFRKLKPAEQTAWSTEQLSEHENSVTHLIRDHYDRLILLETSQFENKFCRECTIMSIHGVHLSTHRMYYKALNDTFDGVILYDIEDKPVMRKDYEVDSESGEFTNLIKEDWSL